MGLLEIVLTTVVVGPVAVILSVQALYWTYWAIGELVSRV